MYPAPRWSWRHRPGVSAGTHCQNPFLYGGMGQPLLIVAAGDARVDNAKYKAQFHQKAKMMSAEELERFTGLHFGGVCPFAMPAPVQVWLDVSLRRFAGSVSLLRQRQQRGALVHPGAGRAQQAHGLGGRVQGLGVNQDE